MTLNDLYVGPPITQNLVQLPIHNRGSLLLAGGSPSMYLHVHVRRVVHTLKKHRFTPFHSVSLRFTAELTVSAGPFWETRSFVEL